ncbi:MAG: ribosomal-processing cysteine protease Prp [Clostridia bacterium]|nr:ribosomal-processing cysteine protease Prp [Clostridia bacterium]
MTKVSITKQDNSIVKIECSGHTGYGVHGEDVVCSALSSVVQTAILGLFGVAGVNVDYVTNADKGYLKAVLPNNLDSATRHDCDVILNTMLLGISDLHEGFSDFIELEVK